MLTKESNYLGLVYSLGDLYSFIILAESNASGTAGAAGAAGAAGTAGMVLEIQLSITSYPDLQVKKESRPATGF